MLTSSSPNGAGFPTTRSLQSWPVSDRQTLARDEAIAFDVAWALVDHGALPELIYQQTVEAFGEHVAAALIYLVGVYCLVSVTLNGFDVPVPEPTAT
jgi:hypothetical protein